MSPFVAFSLPRSRSAWLSVFLSGPGRLVGHDIGVTCSDPAQFAERLTGELAGTCETGAAFAWRLIRQIAPGVRFVVVTRPVDEVTQSLKRFGLDGYEPEMQRRQQWLAEIASQPGTFLTAYEDLSNEQVCEALYTFCHGEPPPAGWWAMLDPLNIQVDMIRRLTLLQANHSQIEALKAMAVEHMPHA